MPLHENPIHTPVSPSRGRGPLPQSRGKGRTQTYEQVLPHKNPTVLPAQSLPYCRTGPESRVSSTFFPAQAGIQGWGMAAGLAAGLLLFLQGTVLGGALDQNIVGLENLVAPVAAFQDNLRVGVEEQVRHYSHVGGF